jgi:hypothetical protein
MPRAAAAPSGVNERSATAVATYEVP